MTAAGRLREKGHRQTKMQLGLPGVTKPAREVEQAKLIREACGPDMDLMCDINQRWRPEQAIDIGRRVEDAGVGLFWLEDVTTHDDYAGLARVADALSTPVAGGEYLYGIVPFRHMLEHRSVDIVMIDQVRSGGITPWLKIAGMAEAFNLPVVSHGVPEIHVHLVGAVPNGLTVEYMPRLFHLWEAVPEPVDGLLDDADRPRPRPQIRRGGDHEVPGLAPVRLTLTRPRVGGAAGDPPSPALREREGAYAVQACGRVRGVWLGVPVTELIWPLPRGDRRRRRHRPACRGVRHRRRRGHRAGAVRGVPGARRPRQRCACSCASAPRWRSSSRPRCARIGRTRRAGW